MAKRKKGTVTNEKIMGFLVEMDERMTNMDDRISDIKNEMTTKTYLADVEQRLSKEIRAISRAVDKDAKTVIGHERRIVVLERKASVSAK